MFSDFETHFLIMGIIFVSIIVQIVFILQKLFGLITWQWWKVLCVVEFYAAVWFLGVVLFSCISIIKVVTLWLGKL
jgi:hypothetical protein